MKKSKIIGIIIALLAPLALWAQDPSITVSAKSQVAVGEQFRVAFEVNADGKHFTAPSFEGFTLVGGPMTSTSSSVQVINGSMSRSVTNTYAYILRAESEGDFTIGSASIKVDGAVVESKPFQIQVVAGAASSATTQQGGQSSGQTQTQSQTNTNDPQVSGQDLFVKVIPSKKSVYVGEPLVLTYKLYTRVSVNQLSVSNMPSYGGFWTKECESQKQASEVVNGIQYTTYEIKKVVLVQQKSGKFTIEPMVVECVAQIMTQRNNQWGNDPFGFFNDPFFSRGYANVPKTIQTSSINIDVKSLPVQGKPDSFDGAVGDYNFTAKVDRDELNTNDAFTLTMTISGKGNVELANLPRPVFPPDFEVYDPKITSSVDVTSQGLSGTKKAEYLVIPRRAGNFTIPSVEFSFFNPAKDAYTALSSPQMNISVAKGAAGDAGGVYASTQEGIKYLGSDIRHIMTEKSGLRIANTHFFASVPYFLILAAMLVVFLIVWALVSKNRRFKQDTLKVRNKQATKVAKGRLKNAYTYLKNNDQDHFYEEMSQALWGYISDKLGIERSVLSMETVKEAMMSKGMAETLADEFVDTLNTCEFARFAPGDAASKMQGLYEKGLEVIMKVEKQ